MTQSRRETWLFWLFALLILGTGLGLRDPWPADEPRFAFDYVRRSVARTVIERQNLQKRVLFFQFLNVFQLGRQRCRFIVGAE